jgi:hypothetical protein
MHRTDWNKGYYQALIGMLLTSRSSNDGYSFWSMLDTNSLSILQQYRRHFLSQLKQKYYEDFDRGYFSSWADYLRFLIKTYKNNQGANNKPQNTGDLHLKT